MILHEFPAAANAQRVNVFLAEKGIDVPRNLVNVREGAQFEAPYAAMNPFHCVPFLELDNGTVIAESLAICRYLEDCHPDPALFGATPEMRAVVEMWNRRFELDAFMPMLHAVRNHVPMFAGRVLPGTRADLAQEPVMVARGRAAMALFLDRVEGHFGEAPFAAGEVFSVADITGFFAVRMTAALDWDIAQSHPNVAAWFGRLSSRPAFQL